MSDLIQKQLALASAGVIFMYWVLVFSTPFLITSQQARSSASLWFWCVVGTTIGYFTYTGFRARRRGWKARFILRIVVPAALLAPRG
jgi:hypothetical protein